MEEPILNHARWAFIVKLWSALSLLAVGALFVHAYVDLSFAGDLGLQLDSDRVYPPLNRVRYTLLGLTYLHGDTVLTGPHRSLGVMLGGLLCTTLLMGFVWRHTRLATARQAFRAGLLSLALLIGVGGPTLAWAETQHNQLLAERTVRPVPRTTLTSASLTRLEVQWCDPPAAGTGCPAWSTSSVPNPALWALILTFVTALAGLWRLT